jgi:hypothetical protein
MFQLKDSNLIFRALIILGLIGFGFFIAVERGLVQLALDSDRSYISYLILGIYVLACVQWIWLARSLSGERQRFAELEAALGAGEPLEQIMQGSESGLVGGFLENWRSTGERKDAEVLVVAFGDELANAHAFGHFTSDVLLRLGLLGTIVGFIFMLLPIAQMQGFDAGMMQELLTAMSGGMAVALYTTLAGLVTSTLLKLQYHVLDASAAQLVTRLSVLVDVRLKRVF